MKKFFAPLLAGVTGMFATAAHAAGELVTTTDGNVTVNPDALVGPVRDSIVDAITSTSTILLIVLAVGVVIYFIHRFIKG